MPKSIICRLCVNECSSFKSLYSGTGQANELHRLAVQYFHPKIVNMDESKHLTVICSQCFRCIYDFHSFQTSVSVAQLKLVDECNVTVPIKIEVVDDVVLEQEDPANPECEPQPQVMEIDNDQLPATATATENPVSNPVKEEQLTSALGLQVTQTSSISSLETQWSKSSNPAPICTMLHINADQGIKSEKSDIPGEELVSSETPQTNYVARTKRKRSELETEDSGYAMTVRDKECDSINQNVNKSSPPETQNRESSIVVDGASINSGGDTFKSETEGHETDHTLLDNTRTTNSPVMNAIPNNLTASSVKDKEMFESCTSTPNHGDISIYEETIDYLESQGKYNCKICGYSSSHKRTVTIHIRHQHRGNQSDVSMADTTVLPQKEDNTIAPTKKTTRFQCDLCERSYSGRRSLREHQRQRHPAEYGSKERTTKVSTSVQFHIETKSMKYKCKLCQKSFGSKGFLKVHKSNEHQNESQAQDNLLQNTHVGEKLKCNLCDCEYYHKGHLDIHLERRHGIVRKENKVDFECQQCHKLFPRWINLTRHIARVHEPSGAYTCEQCGQSFNKFSKYKYHLLHIHKVGAVPTCEFCGKTFPTHYALRVHLAKHSSVPTFSCPYCPKTFKFNTTLKSHKIKVHPDKLNDNNSSWLEETLVLRVDTDETLEEYCLVLTRVVTFLFPNYCCTMPKSIICRLCVNECSSFKSLYSGIGQANELHRLTVQYFHPKIVNMDESKHLTVICSQCFRCIYDFHSFQSSVSVAQLKLVDECNVMVPIKIEVVDDVVLEQEDPTEPECELQPQVMEIDDDQLTTTTTRTATTENHVLSSLKDEPLTSALGLQVSQTSSMDGLEDTQWSKNSNSAPICTMLHINNAEPGIKSKQLEIPGKDAASGGQIKPSNTLARSTRQRSQIETNNSGIAMTVIDKQTDVSNQNANEVSSTETQNQESPKEADSQANNNESVEPETEENDTDYTLLNFTLTNPVFASSPNKDGISNNGTVSSFKDKEDRIKYTTSTPNKQQDVSIYEKYIEYDGSRGKYNCNICGHSSSYERNVSIHIRHQHRGNLTELSMTQTTVLPDKVDTINDTNTTTEYKCDLCSCSYAEKSLLERHQNEKHPQEYTAKGNTTKLSSAIRFNFKAMATKYMCKRCKKTFRTKGFLRMHTANEHPNLSHKQLQNYYSGDKFKCNLCDSVYYHKGRFVTHLERQHGKHLKEPKSGLECEQCHKVFAAHIYLKRHLVQVHEPPGSFTCSECGKSFDRSSKYKFHLLHRHKIGAAVPSCEYCGKILRDHYALRMHLTTHSNLANYPCPYCPKTFKYNQNLKAHKLRFHLDKLNENDSSWLDETLHLRVDPGDSTEE